MVKKILQVNFKYKLTEEELLKRYDAAYDYFVKLEGLEWKIWLHNPATKTTGAIYLFKDEKSVKDYLNSDMVARIKANYFDVEMKVFDILPKYTNATRGPV